MMRRKDREVTDPEQIRAILDSCDVCRIALNTPDGYPYILPLNFGMEWSQSELPVLYFHSATEGRKHELISADPRAAFEMDCDHCLAYSVQRGYCTMNYRSVMGYGVVEYVTDEAEKMRALTLLTDRYHEGHFAFNPAAMSRTSVYRLRVLSLTAKCKNSKV